jgi:LPXTG-site transpeptidase (sortase) family protein
MNKFLFRLGNAMILLSMAGFVFIFYPFIALYLSPAPIITEVQAKQGTFITIPKIHAQSQVIENVDPMNESIYNEALKKGVAHAKGTSLPGQKGTTFLFAHSSGNPWELTRMNTIFLRLGELQTEDTIELVKDGQTFIYKVTDKKEVDPTEVNYLLQTTKDQLILQTCTPIGTSLKRLLIFAKPMQ